MLGKTDVSTLVDKLEKLRQHVEATLQRPYGKRGKPAFL
jgi:hypothetical protein